MIASMIDMINQGDSDLDINIARCYIFLIYDYQLYLDEMSSRNILHYCVFCMFQQGHLTR